MISDLYSAAMASTPATRPYLKSKGQTLSYADVDASVRKLATLFSERGLVEGDYVLLQVSNDHQLAVIYLACICTGMAAVITDPSLPALDSLLALMRPRLAFIDREKLGNCDSAAGLDVIAVDQPQRKTRGVFKKILGKGASADAADTAAYPGLLDSCSPLAGAFPSIDPETTALVLFTSGTTSEPKGVEISQRNMSEQLRIVRQRYRVTADAEIFNNLPLYHTDGITNGITLALVTGATLHRPGRFTVHELPLMMDYIYREGISHLFTVPTVLALMLRLGTDFSDSFQSGDFKVLVSSAGLLAPELWRSFEERFRVRISNGYGLTETVSIFSFCGPDDESYRIGSVGLPVASEVRVVNELGQAVPQGDEGELLVRGALVMKGYLNNPEATAAAIVDGWFRTGDLARLAADGKIEIRGRKKNIIIRGGINIHPAEITNVALRHPAVIHAAAFGEPDATWGEIAVLCVVEEPAHKVSDVELQAFLRQQLANEKMPDEIHRFADFPSGPAGKVLQDALREQVQLRRDSRAFSDQGDPFEVIAGIGAALLKVDPGSLSRDSSAENMNGWDSLFHLNFILAVEETYSIEFLAREIMAVQTLGDLVDLAQQYHQRG